MKQQAYQPGEMRDENDNIIRAGSWGKKTAFVTGDNKGVLDYIINNFDAHERKLTVMGVSSDADGNPTLSPFVEEQMTAIKEAAETARDLASSYKTAAETAKDGAVAAQTAAEAAKNGAVAAQSAAEAARDQAMATTPDGFEDVATAALEFSYLGLSVDSDGYIIQTVNE